MDISKEREFYLDADNERLLCVHYPACEESRGAMLFFNPLFEERKTCQRPMVELARGLAAKGIDVLRFDYAGCGDSSGAIADYGITDWLANASHAFECLKKIAADAEIGLFGIRAGASLAWLFNCEHDAVTGPIILCNPVINGTEYLRDELRKKLMKEMITFGDSQSTRREMIAELENGKAIDFDGYEISARLYRDLSKIDLLESAKAFSRRRVLLGIIAPTGADIARQDKLKAAWTAAGVEVEQIEITAEPFWNRIGLTDTLPLKNAVCEWAAGNFKFTPKTRRQAEPENYPRSISHNSTADKNPAMPAESTFCLIGDDNQVIRAIQHTPPDTAPPHCAVVFCHGWSGSRLGPHRMFVKTARRLTASGMLCFRPDFIGRGNSDGPASAGGIQQMIRDTRAVLKFIRQHNPGLPIVLLGICSGGKVALGAGTTEPDVGGLVIWSGEALGGLRHEKTNRRKSTHALKTYLYKIFQPSTWRKIVTGRVNLGGVRKAVFSHETRTQDEAVQEDKIVERFRRQKTPVCFIYGTHDPETKLAGTNYIDFCEKHTIPYSYHPIEKANHSFYSLISERQVIDLTEKWLLEKKGVA